MAYTQRVALAVKSPPAREGYMVRSLGGEGPLEEGAASHSSIFAWKIHAQRSLPGYGPQGHKE